MTTKKPTYVPLVGEHLYISQRTGNYWVDSVKRPHTVIKVTDKEVIIQECLLVFNGVRYYDTLPDDIKENPNGELKILKWSNAKRHTGWIAKDASGAYPYIAHFGRWEFEPYLN